MTLATLKKNIPNILTAAGLFMGFSAVLACLQAVHEASAHEESFMLIVYLKAAGLFIIVGIAFDFFDGFAARALNVQSRLGKQLDSLSDLITFGIAPGVLFYTVTLLAGRRIDSIVAYNVLFVPGFIYNNLFIIRLMAFLFPATACIRLARFSIHKSKDFFYGLPTTVAGSLMALLFTFNFYITPFAKLYQIWDKELPQQIYPLVHLSETVTHNFTFLLLVYVILSILMVSEIQFYKITYYFKGWGRRKRKWIIIISFLALVLFFKYFLLLLDLLYFIHNL